MASALQLGTSQSTFAGRHVAFKSSPVVSRVTVRPASVAVEAKKVCQLTGKKRNKANSVTFSNKHSRKWQDPNLQYKKVFWASGQRWVNLRICTKAIKTLEKNGLDAMAAEAGIDLWKLPFEDARPERLAYLEQNKGKVPQAKNARAMKNPAKLASSTKQPRYPVYEEGGRIVWIKPGMEALIFGEAEAASNQQQATEEPELSVTLTE